MQRTKDSTNSEFRIRLQEEFSRRVRANERYSIRAFALQLGINSSTLSQILSGKRKLTDFKINLLYRKMGLPDLGTGEGVQSEFSTLDLDSFAVISDWYHFAILDLALLKTFKSDVKWIARKLNIQIHEAQMAIDRMLRLGLLVQKEGRLCKGSQFYSNYTEGVTSAALKEYQRQVITKALQAVDQCPQERKDITSMTIAANSKKLKAAKEKIKKFRRELCTFLEDEESDSVFHFALQLYPVTEVEN